MIKSANGLPDLQRAKWHFMRGPVFDLLAPEDLHCVNSQQPHALNAIRYTSMAWPLLK